MRMNYILLNMKSFGDNLWAAIVKSGYSVAELQQMLFLSTPQQIYRWIKGCSLPSTENLYRLSVLLKVRMEDLLNIKSEHIQSNYIMLDKELFGKNLNAAIIRSGYSISDLSCLLRLSGPQPIYRWIKGLTFPNVEHLFYLCIILNVHMEELLTIKFNDKNAV